MKCPACDSHTPSGRPTCTRCGASLPAIDPRSGPEIPPHGQASPPGWEPPPKRGPFQPRDDESAGSAPFGTGPVDARPARESGAEAPLDALTTPIESGSAEDRTASPPDGTAEDRGEAGAAPGTARFDESGSRHEAPTAWDASAPWQRRRHRKAPEGARRRWVAPVVTVGIVAVASVSLVLALGVSEGPHPAPRLRTGPQSSAALPTEEPNATPEAGESPSDAVGQATAVNAILSAGKDTHDRLSVSLDTCEDLVTAIPTFQQVVQERQGELEQARQVATDRLSGGAELKQAMIDAYESSLDADKAYLAWAQEAEAQGCDGDEPPQSENQRAVKAANDRAGPAKRRVAALWNPIAQSQGMPTYPWNAL